MADLIDQWRYASEPDHLPDVRGEIKSIEEDGELYLGNRYRDSEWIAGPAVDNEE